MAAATNAAAFPDGGSSRSTGAMRQPRAPSPYFLITSRPRPEPDGEYLYPRTQDFVCAPIALGPATHAQMGPGRHILPRDCPLPGRSRARTPPAARLVTLRLRARAQVLAELHHLLRVGGGSSLESGWRVGEREERWLVGAPALSGDWRCLSRSRASRATAHPLAPASRPLAGARRCLCASLKSGAYRRKS